MSSNFSFKNHFNIIFPATPSSKWSRFLGLFVYNSAWAVLFRYIFLAHPLISRSIKYQILIITIIICGEEYKSRTFSLCRCLHPPSSVQIYSSSGFQTPSVYDFSLMSETKFLTHTKPQSRCSFVYTVGLAIFFLLQSVRSRGEMRSKNEFNLLSISL